MQKSVSIIDPLNEPTWNDMVLQFGKSTIFHSANWAKLLVECYGYQPRYITLLDEGEMTACIPVMEVDSFLTGRRGVCLTFSDFCGALLSANAQFDLLYEALLDLGRMRGWKYVELRGEDSLDHEIPAKLYVHDIINLNTDEEQMREKLKDSTARNIRKAVKEGVHTSICRSMSSVREFYQLHCLTRKRHGVPPQPIAFFEKLYDHIISKGLGFTALAQVDGKIIAGLICLTFGNNAIYKYGASDPKFQHLRANNLLLWTAMVQCVKEGCSELSLGRTDIENKGLLTFKNGWGGVRTVLKYHRYNFYSSTFDQKPQWNLNVHKSLLRALPLKALMLMGRLLYRHLG